jgi:hypothetical protein
MTATPKSTKHATASARASKVFSDDERAAMKNRAQEFKSEARANKDKEEGESAVRSAIAELREPDRDLAERLDAIIRASAPALSPKTWYGMPAYAREGKIVCFFQSSQKFKTRYATLGFNEDANLDEGSMWPVAYALTELTAADEARIRALVKKAAG